MKGLFGCLGFIISVILIIFVLTHISEIWHWLERLFT
jgi:hypothetical protein